MISVSKALSVLAKPALVGWANRMGLKGIDTSKYNTKRSGEGMSVHDAIEAWMHGESEEGCPDGFKKFISTHTVEPLLAEVYMEHSSLGYCGRIDAYCMVNGKLCLLDFKTSKGIYDDMFYQLAAYRELLEDNGKPVDRVAVVRLYGDDYEYKIKERTVQEFEVFKHCLEIYRLTKGE